MVSTPTPVQAPDSITCKVTSWFVIRAAFSAVLFLFFAGYFYYDGTVGYCKENENFYQYGAKTQVKEYFLKANRISENKDSTSLSSENPAATNQSWQQYMAQNTVKLYDKRDVVSPESLVTDTEGCFREGFTYPIAFLPEYANSYDALLANPAYADEIWAKHAAENDLDVTVSEFFKPLSDIKSQIHWAIGSAALGGIALLFLARNSFRTMQVTEEYYKAPNGKKILFTDITKIDKRKWRTKGKALITFKDESGEEKSAKIDGFLYGQFDESKPNNAEALYQWVESRASSADIIDYQDEEDEKVEETDDQVEKDEAAK
ncbi:hypothetical protein OAB00_02405 [Akkermansiaceae bacterium]|nr:hypothetical protein [Akkermansiaceae bacterium]